MNLLFSTEIKHDFALIELEEDIERDQYFELAPNNFSLPELVVSGFLKDADFYSFRQVTHSRKLAEIQSEGAFYDIDTK
jgi:hypothetical protein